MPVFYLAVTPTITRLMGYDGLVINRIHHALKGSFKTSKNMEFIWRGYDVGQKDQTDMITHVLHTHYSAPQGFDWEEGAMGVDTNSASWRSNEFVNIMKVRNMDMTRAAITLSLMADVRVTLIFYSDQ